MKKIMFGDVCSARTHSINIIVHGCNAQGVMGSGVALAVKNRWPEAFLMYRDYVLENGVGNPQLLGRVIPYFDTEQGVIIANAITQVNFGKHNRRYVSYEAVHVAFNTVVEIASAYADSAGIHYPMIGAGLGGGDWSIISSIIDSAFVKSPSLAHYLWLLD